MADDRAEQGLAHSLLLAVAPAVFLVALLVAVAQPQALAQGDASTPVATAAVDPGSTQAISGTSPSNVTGTLPVTSGLTLSPTVGPTSPLTPEPTPTLAPSPTAVVVTQTVLLPYPVTETITYYVYTTRTVSVSVPQPITYTHYVTVTEHVTEPGWPPSALYVGGGLLALVALGCVVAVALMLRRRATDKPAEGAPPPPLPPAAPEPIPQPILRSAADPALAFPLERRPLGIGRADDNDLLIDGRYPGWETVSQHHARLEWDGGRQRWIVVDQASRNGVLVHGKRTRENVLRDGDQVCFGSVEFVFQERV
jgi:hypothetical protein